MPKNTYILSPNFSTAPDGAIRLGHVLADVSEFVPLNRNRIVPIEQLNPVDWKGGIRINNTQAASGHLSLFGQILNLIGVSASLHGSRRHGSILSINCLETQSFDPTDGYVTTTVKLPDVEFFRTETRNKRPLFLVTGLKIGRESSTLNMTENSDFGADVGLHVSPSVVSSPVGGHIGGSYASNNETTFANSTDFIVAVRVRKITFKHNQPRHAPYDKYATMSGANNSGSGGDTSEETPEFTVSDVTVEDVTTGQVHVVEDTDGEEIWLVSVNEV